MKATRAAFWLFGAATSALGAQPLFTSLDKRLLPAGSDMTFALAAGDVDRDGDRDLIVGNGGGGRLRLLLAIGGGRFEEASPTRLPSVVAATAAIALGDVDGDGDLDFVCANGGVYGSNGYQSEQSLLFLNDGRGGFTDATVGRLPLANWEARAVGFGDMDGDGDLDLVFGLSSGSLLQLLLNDGTGHFQNVSAARMPFVYPQAFCLTLTDIDRDGDLDVLASGTGAVSTVLLVNSGNAFFADETTQRLPTTISGTFSAVAALDVDSDGDQDVVLGSRLMLNDGSGRFVDATASHFPSFSDQPLAIAAGDVDGDGDVDLWFGNGAAARQDRLLRNDGTGHFSFAAGTVPAEGASTAAVAMADFDGDGDLDVVQGNGGFGLSGEQNRLLRNNGGGVFSDATDVDVRLPSASYSGSDALSVDIDGDGDLDLVCSDRNGSNRLYRNDGTATFTDITASHLPLPALPLTMGVAAGDLEGDGDVDLVFACGEQVGGQSRLCVNDGTGHFTDNTAFGLPPRLARSMDVALGDVDGDGDLDIILPNWQAPNLLYLNDGRGTFTDATAGRLPVPVLDSRKVSLADVDGDGDLDILFVNYNAPSALYLNSGSGVFTDATSGRLPNFVGTPNAAVFADVDHDMDVDLVFACSGQSRLMVNDGQGHFTDQTTSRMPTASDNALSLAAVDVDGDGNVDLVFGNTYDITPPIRLLLNGGTGTFVEASGLVGTNDGTIGSLAAADFDADGDVDLFLGAFALPAKPPQMLLNLLRQVDLPLPAVRGKPYRIQIYARHGLPRTRDIAAPFLATARASIPLPPLGIVGLDPATILALPPFIIPAADGTGFFDLTIPNTIPGGLPLHAQAVVIQEPRSAHLTNVRSDVVAR